MGTAGWVIPKFAAAKEIGLIEAGIRAVGESIERYSAAIIDEAALSRIPMCALEGKVVDPRDLCLYTEASINALVSRSSVSARNVRIPGHVVIGWMMAALWVPALPVYLSPPCLGEPAYCQSTSERLGCRNEHPGG